MSDVLLVALISGATFFLSYVVVESRIMTPAMNRVRTWFDTKYAVRKGLNTEVVLEQAQWVSHPAYLTACYWCVGFWISGVVTLSTWVAHDLTYPVLSWLTAATITGLFSKHT